MKGKQFKIKAVTKTGQRAAKRVPAPDALIAVYRFLLEGHSKADILDACRQNFPKEDPKALIAAATDAFRIVSKESPDIQLGWCMEATRELFRKMSDIGDYIGALRCVKQLHDMSKQHTAGKKQDPIAAVLREIDV